MSKWLGKAVLNVQLKYTSRRNGLYAEMISRRNGHAEMATPNCPRPEKRGAGIYKGKVFGYE